MDMANDTLLSHVNEWMNTLLSHVKRHSETLRFWIPKVCKELPHKGRLHKVTKYSAHSGPSQARSSFVLPPPPSSRLPLPHAVPRCSEIHICTQFITYLRIVYKKEIHCTPGTCNNKIPSVISSVKPVCNLMDPWEEEAAVSVSRIYTLVVIRSNCLGSFR